MPHNLLYDCGQSLTSNYVFSALEVVHDEKEIVVKWEIVVIQ